MKLKPRLANLFYFLIAFILTLVIATVFLNSRTTELVPGVTTTPLTADCDLMKYSPPIKLGYTIALACTRKDLIRLWPLPIVNPWVEDVPRPPEIEVFWRTDFSALEQ